MPPAPEQACLCCALTKDLFTRSPLVTVASSWLSPPLESRTRLGLGMDSMQDASGACSLENQGKRGSLL
jgi:hypothetical protein